MVGLNASVVPSGIGAIGLLLLSQYATLPAGLMLWECSLNETWKGSLNEPV